MKKISDPELQNKVDQLKASIETLDANIITLVDALNSMNSKLVTPENIADVVTGYAVKFGMDSYGSTDTWSGATLGGPIAYDGVEWFYGISANEIRRTKPGGTMTTIATSSYALGSVTYDRSNDYIHVGQVLADTVGSGVNAYLETYDTSGNLIYSVQITNPAINELSIKALAYDNDGNKLYLLYQGPTSDIVRYGEVDPSTGQISNYVDIDEFYIGVVEDMDIYNNVLYMNDTYTGTGMLYGFAIGEPTVKFLASFPTVAPGVSHSYFYGFVIDPTTLTWYLDVGNDYFMSGAFVHVQRIQNFDFSMSVDDGGQSITVDATSLPLPSGAATSAKQTTMITALQKIDDLQKALRSVSTDVLITQIEEAGSIDTDNVAMSDTQAEIVAARADRKGLLIQNVDTTDTVWIGPTGVATGTGIELLPKQSTVLNYYTGSTASIFGICDAGKTANIRYLEAF